MPTAPRKICGHPGCMAIATGDGRCSNHHHTSAQAAYDRTRRKVSEELAQAAKIRGGPQWKKVRSLHRSQNPLCCDPFGDHLGFPAPNQQSHHIQALVTHPELAYDLTNLAALCTACHAKVERFQRAGTPTQHLFGPDNRSGTTTQTPGALGKRA